MRTLFFGAVVAAMIFTSVSCDDEPAPQDHVGVLQEADLTVPVESVHDTQGRNTKAPMTCAALDLPESSISIGTGDGSVGRSYDLTGGGTITSSLLAVSTNYPTAADALARVDAAISECVAQPKDETGAYEERLNGLPGEAIGYRSVAVGDTGQSGIEKAYAPVGEDHVVAVEIESNSDGEFPVRAEDLLAKALDRAAADLGSDPDDPDA